MPPTLLKQGASTRDRHRRRRPRGSHRASRRGAGARGRWRAVQRRPRRGAPRRAVRMDRRAVGRPVRADAGGGTRGGRRLPASSRSGRSCRRTLASPSWTSTAPPRTASTPRARPRRGPPRPARRRPAGGTRAVLTGTPRVRAGADGDHARGLGAGPAGRPGRRWWIRTAGPRSPATLRPTGRAWPASLARADIVKASARGPRVPAPRGDRRGCGGVDRVAGAARDPGHGRRATRDVGRGRGGAPGAGATGPRGGHGRGRGHVRRRVPGLPRSKAASRGRRWRRKRRSCAPHASPSAPRRPSASAPAPTRRPSTTWAAGRPPEADGPNSEPNGGAGFVTVQY